MIINTTPHPITIIGSENNNIIRQIPPAECPWRLVERRQPGFYIEGIPVNRVTFENPQDTPRCVEGIYYIVSQIIKHSYPDREDFIAPDEMVRSVDGEIIGCKSFRI